MMTEKQRMLSGKLYNPYQVESNWGTCKEVLSKFNSMSWKEAEERMLLLKQLFGRLGEGGYIEPPFYCDHGDKIFIGTNFYANTELLILDEAEVIIGNNVFFAPRVSIYTAAHPIDAFVRNTKLEYAKKVTIGNDVWIGGNVVINPGVHIGNNVVIGSGSVVTKDIPDGVIAAGNPCRVIRAIEESDRIYWKNQMEEYYSEQKKKDAY